MEKEKNEIIFSDWFIDGITNAFDRYFQEAIENFKEGIKLFPDHKIILFFMGIIYEELENYEKAIDCFKKIIEIDSEFDRALYDLGYCYLNLGNYQKTIEFCEKVIEVNPEDTATWLNMGIAYDGLNNPQKAIECLEKILALDPNDKKALYELNRIKYRNKRMNRIYGSNIDDSLKILKSRLAKGEITLEDYNKLKKAIEE